MWCQVEVYEKDSKLRRVNYEQEDTPSVFLSRKSVQSIIVDALNNGDEVRMKAR